MTLIHLQLFPQCGHKNPQGGQLRGHVFGGDAPNLADDIVVGQHLPGIFGQQAQQFVLNGGQMQLLAVPIGAAGGLVDDKATVLVPGRLTASLLAVVPHPAEGHPQPGQQLSLIHI